ncbi:hypothetical protein GG496_001648 [Candidatus Fervidibacteria bacterium JGI MDM2 JNZ-1-D12]
MRKLCLTFFTSIIVGGLLIAAIRFPLCTNYCPNRYPDDVVDCQECCQDCCRRNYTGAIKWCAEECFSYCNYTVP